MPWKEVCVMDQKAQMIRDWLSGRPTVAELSLSYDVSRKTIYKWLARYEADSINGLLERSRASYRHPNAVAAEIIEMLIAAKLSHQRWGPKKIVAWLADRHADQQWPAISTVGEILRREGLVRHRKRKRRAPPYTEPFLDCCEPNDVWSADYKGQFRTTDGRLCYPLTITDNRSRYILECRGLHRPSYEETQPWFERAFKEYGLPTAIRNDNGFPFASTALGGLTKLSVWFIKLGIRPERIEPGHPEQNGRHERMHRSLKEATVRPPKATLQAQQRAFDQFIYEYNWERPHEALELQTPASIYRPSTKRYPDKLPEVEYGGNAVVRQVRSNGEIKWKGGHIFVSETLIGEPIALEQKEEHVWEMRYSFHPLGMLHDTTGKVVHTAYPKTKKV